MTAVAPAPQQVATLEAVLRGGGVLSTVYEELRDNILRIVRRHCGEDCLTDPASLVTQLLPHVDDACRKLQSAVPSSASSPEFFLTSYHYRRRRFFWHLAHAVRDAARLGLGPNNFDDFHTCIRTEYERRFHSTPAGATAISQLLWDALLSLAQTLRKSGAASVDKAVRSEVTAAELVARLVCDDRELERWLLGQARNILGAVLVGLAAKRLYRLAAPRAPPLPPPAQAPALAASSQPLEFTRPAEATELAASGGNLRRRAKKSLSKIVSQLLAKDRKKVDADALREAQQAFPTISVEDLRRALTREERHLAKSLRRAAQTRGREPASAGTALTR